jgi:RNA polymerase sigma-70 factor (ECF subfamily)
VATTDAELVTRARAGEVDALGVLLDRYRVPLYATAMALLGDREAALDAVQNAYLVALTRLDGLRDPGAVGGWLRTIVRNCGLMHLRRTRHEIVSDDVDLASFPGPEQVLEDHALRDWIWTTLDTLTEEDRVAVVLRHFTRCRSYEAIAAVTAVPVGTVRSRLNRARRLLVHALTTGADRKQRDQAGWRRSAGSSGSRSTTRCTRHRSPARTATSTAAMSR